MDSSHQATEPPTVVRTENNIQSGMLPTDDQYFLLYFIMGTFFGPDLKGERPLKSVLQRMAEQLPPYTSSQLAGSHMKTVEVERVYHYVLRKANRSVLVKLPLLHQFFQGNLPALAGQDPATMYPQFPNLFPPQFHPHSRFKNRYKVIDNIVFINNPEIFYIKPEDIERFKRLTGLEDFLLDRDGARFYTSAAGGLLYDMAVQDDQPNGELLAVRPLKTRRVDDIMVSEKPFQYPQAAVPVSIVPYNGTPLLCSGKTRHTEEVSPAMIFLPSHPDTQEWDNIIAATRSGFALTGSAAMGQVGPVVGLVDIGECDDSYIFRVSLPGVKRDEKEFSCEVEIDGKVLIRGVTTTGEQRVYMHSQVFDMQSQNLCPPGHFSISFQLPGPVAPNQFSGNFGTNGILEGIVMKASPKTTSGKS